jgi:hypothetical protein
VSGNVQLTTRTADSFFWLGAPGQQLPAYKLASAIPQVGWAACLPAQGFWPQSGMRAARRPSQPACLLLGGSLPTSLSLLPQVGNLMALLYKGAKTGTSHTISAVDVHGHGVGGVGLRLWFQAGEFKLQPGVSPRGGGGA